eukprot:9724329-Alexandrium_andersonii.AAC.1
MFVTKKKEQFMQGFRDFEFVPMQEWIESQDLEDAYKTPSAQMKFAKSIGMTVHTDKNVLGVLIATGRKKFRVGDYEAVTQEKRQQ